MKRKQQDRGLFTRREVLGVLGSIFGLATLSACENSDPGTEKLSDARSILLPSSCRVTPRGEIGPYFADDLANGFYRSNILANIDGTDTQSGIPLELTIYIVDAENGCHPMPDVQVDIWHCNANGTYSDIDEENTIGLTWLRGYQLSDKAGKLVFNTIVPGWYHGRTTHIHLRIRSIFSETTSPFDSANTTQLFFPQTMVDIINTTAEPYKTRGANPTTNAVDQVFMPQTGGKMMLPLSGNNTNGYSSSVTISLPIAG